MAKKKRKRSSGGKKGSPYERAICKRLSLWWTDGERDDVFWRTSNSGGRATVRQHAGKVTAGQYGDIGATDPIGAAFTDLFVVELKRGYSRNTLQDVFDASVSMKEQQYAYWISRAEWDVEQAGAYSWMLIVKRDRRRDIVILPNDVARELGLTPKRVGVPFMRLRFGGFEVNGLAPSYWCMRLDDFLALVGRGAIEELK